MQMEPENPTKYQQLFDTGPDRGHSYSIASAVVISSVRLLFGLLRLLVLPIWIAVRYRRGKPLRLARAVWTFFLGKWLIESLSGTLDRRFARDIDRVQGERNEQASRPASPPASLARAVQPGERLAAIPDRLMDRDLGWNPARQAELGGELRPRCLFLRPFVPDNRFLCEIAPFTSADPEPLSKFPRMEVSFFRLVHGLGGEFVSSGMSPVATGSPRRLLDAGWRREIREEIEAADLIFLVPFYTEGTRWEVETVVEGGHLKKTLFLMPPSVLGTGMDQRADDLIMALIHLWIAVKAIRGLGSTIGSDAVEFEYTGRRLRIVLRDPGLNDDWEMARESYAVEGLTLPRHHELGAVFSYEMPNRPVLRARLATIHADTDSIHPDAAELRERIRSLTELTGGNARSLLAAIDLSGGGYGHAPDVIAAALNILERKQDGLARR